MTLLFLQAAPYSTVSMHNSFWIHSGLVGYLGCFCILTTVPSTAMNASVQRSFQRTFLCLGNRSQEVVQRVPRMLFLYF